MNNLTQNLIKTLMEITDHYMALKAVLKEEKDIMVKSTIDDLEACTKQKETILLKLKILDESRKKLISNIANALKMNEHTVTISAIALRLEKKPREILQQVSANLTKLIKETAAKNDENRIFIELFMNRIKLTLSFYDHSNVDELTYLNSGEAKGINIRKRVLCKA